MMMLKVCIVDTLHMSFIHVLYFQSSVKQWQKVFFISAGIYGIGALVYAIFGSGKKQPWAEPEKENEREHNGSYDGT